jgi:large subunit ribosomal protein L31
MKANIHPKYYDQAEVNCACGNMFTVGSTKAKISVETCYKCHPLFTGEERFVDTQGQVEKFMAKRKYAEKRAKEMPKKMNKNDKKQASQKTLKDLLTAI